MWKTDNAGIRGTMALAVVVVSALAAMFGLHLVGAALGSGSSSTESPAAVRAFFSAGASIAPALEALGNRLRALPASATPAQIQGAVNPTVSVIDRSIADLSGVAWPAGATSDAREFVLALGALASDVGAVGSAGWNEPQWAQVLSRDLQTGRARADFLRHDLGLAPASQK